MATENGEYVHILNIDNMNSTIRDKVEYAVRGKIVTEAEELKEKIKKNPSGHGLPFNEVIFCNIGNPQSLQQKPLTFLRQVLSLLEYPELLDNPPPIYKADAVARARKYLKGMPSIGAYTNSKGLDVVREEVAQFIQHRDNFPSNMDDIYLTDGASSAVKTILSVLIRDPSDGILIPIPQYPLYSATIPLFNGTALHYYLDEPNGWALQISELQKSVDEARAKKINPRALVIINPGNPTGQCLSKQNMIDIVQFCHKNRIILLADEVYQQNCYNPAKPFTSFKNIVKTLSSSQPEYNHFELVSFHSVSKGFVGECGQRGGYMEMVGIADKVKEQIYKLVSVSLCSNVPGQITVGLMVNPPKKGEESFEQYEKESRAIYESLARRGKKVAERLNKLEGVVCNEAEGAMYLFPQIKMPEKALKEAEKRKTTADGLYCVELLNETGIVVVPGSGFGQRQGTSHFRTTFLPPEDKIDKVVESLGKFHEGFMKRYK
eukprot:TRINITY_DN1401_c0_g1_i1.p1 TRINITY_DN1401_c0_g1~~TRINITY_DN1401_c0_g1_i1.p1  ORF type:complete len:491 (-),score=147.59 TRINITY_DN1401_c0_g1_i1:42-1514(-)